MQRGIIRRGVMFALIVLIVGAAIAIPLERYAELDDAQGGVVIACGIFTGSALLAAWIVERP